MNKSSQRNSWNANDDWLSNPEERNLWKLDAAVKVNQSQSIVAVIN